MARSMPKATANERLLDIYSKLLAAYGPQSWWPARTPFEVMVGAVLVQSAAWSNVEKAIVNLKAVEALTPDAIRSLETAEFARLVYPSGYYNAKARKLKALVEHLGERYSDDIDAMVRRDTTDLRTELLAVHGIGEETADDILLYALGHPVFVVDAYTRRLVVRLGLMRESDASYSTCQALFTDNLKSDVAMFNEFHALIVRHSVEHCRKRPLCDGCVLLEMCPTGGAAEAQKIKSSS
jgi:endonuclease-3 related protein